MAELARPILVCPAGFVHARKRRPEAFRFDDIASVVQDDSTSKRVAPAGDGPPMTARTTFLVKLKDGRRFEFGGHSLRRHLQFARLLHAEAASRNVPWEIVTR